MNPSRRLMLSVNGGYHKRVLVVDVAQVSTVDLFQFTDSTKLIVNKVDGTHDSIEFKHHLTPLLSKEYERIGKDVRFKRVLTPPEIESYACCICFIDFYEAILAELTQTCETVLDNTAYKGECVVVNTGAAALNPLDRSDIDE